jgi:hypothetical protein
MGHGPILAYIESLSYEHLLRLALHPDGALEYRVLEGQRDDRE